MTSPSSAPAITPRILLKRSATSSVATPSATSSKTYDKPVEQMFIRLTSAAAKVARRRVVAPASRRFCGCFRSPVERLLSVFKSLHLARTILNPNKFVYHRSAQAQPHSYGHLPGRRNVRTLPPLLCHALGQRWKRPGNRAVRGSWLPFYP